MSVNPSQDDRRAENEAADLLQRTSVSFHLMAVAFGNHSRQLRAGKIDLAEAFARANGTANDLRWARTDPPAQRGAE